MLAITRERRNTLSYASENRETEIQQRQQQVGSDGMVNPVEIQTKEGKEEPEDGASRVAHENSCGRKIEEQEAQACAKKGPGNRHAHRRRSGRVQQDVSEAGDGHNTGREAIGAVEKVESVYKQHDKQTREADIQPCAAEDVQPPLCLRNKQTRHNLRDQTNSRRQATQIVDEPGQPHDQKGDKNS